MKLRAIEPLPRLRRRPDEGLARDNVEDAIAEYAAQGSPKWLAALLVISAFLFGGLAFALVERWMRG